MPKARTTLNVDPELWKKFMTHARKNHGRSGTAHLVWLMQRDISEHEQSEYDTLSMMAERPNRPDRPFKATEMSEEQAARIAARFGYVKQP